MTSLDHGSQEEELNANGTHRKRQRFSLRRPRTKQPTEQPGPPAASTASTSSPTHGDHDEQQRLHEPCQQSVADTSSTLADNAQISTSIESHSKEENHRHPQRSLIARITSAAFATTTSAKKSPVSPLSTTASHSSSREDKRTSFSSVATRPSVQATHKQTNAGAGQLAPEGPQPADTVSREDSETAQSIVPTSATKSAPAATKQVVSKRTTRSTLAGNKRKLADLTDNQDEQERQEPNNVASEQSSALDLDLPASKVDDSETQTGNGGKILPVDTITAFDEIVDDWDEEDLKALQEMEDQTKNDVPDNACPVCGINLLALNDVTPEGHVNRCLDSPPTADTSSGISSETAAPAADTLANTSSGTHFSSVTSILGTVQQVVVNSVSTSISSISNTIVRTTATARITTSTSSTTIAKVSKKTSTRTTKPSRPCPFYKKMPDTTFTVDAFSYGCIPECTAYFLSHFHSDHYGGLTSSWKHGPIYCSSITANLVLSRLNVDAQYVRRLPMYEPTVIEGVTVRLLDANHCPGSVLFVFDLPPSPTAARPRRYLHTGDFRAHPSMITHPILRQPDNPQIDILYLDTTYINPKYTFPPQDDVVEATAQMVAKELGIGATSPSSGTTAAAAPKPAPKKNSINIMESWLKRMDGNSAKLKGMTTKQQQQQRQQQAAKSNLSIWGTQRGSRGPTRYPGTWPDQVDGSRVLVCVGTYLIGKERVFMAIAKAIHSKVFVQPAKLKILECLEDPELMAMLTNDPQEAQVHLVHMGSELSPASLQLYLDSLQPRFERVIGIRPTGWSFSSSKKAGPESAARPPPMTSGNGCGGSSSSSSSVGGIGGSSSSNGDEEKKKSQDWTSIVLKPSYVSEKIKIFGVPYSEHSSFSELAGFVRSLQIAQVIPTVGVGTEKGRATMRAWFDRWAKERDRGLRWHAPEDSVDLFSLPQQPPPLPEECEQDFEDSSATENGSSSSPSSASTCHTPQLLKDTPLRYEEGEFPLLPEEFDI
ncbi:hypothetical protein BGW41_001489 [Actinomortierella wolfii]|nr:hypothetical protein BGW41_001489 [Actinomortierella wolfii]